MRLQSRIIPSYNFVKPALADADQNAEPAFPGGIGIHYCNLIIGNCKMKSTSFSRRRIHPYPAAMQLDYFFNMRQPDPRTFIVGTVVQALEDDENPFLVLLFDADAIIAEGKLPG